MYEVWKIYERKPINNQLIINFFNKLFIQLLFIIINDHECKKRKLLSWNW